MAGPLQGIKILDLSIALTGPYAVALLADQGADVIKVERPGFGDIARYIGVSVNGTSALFTVCNRGKRSIAVDVHDRRGRDVIKKLAARSDVVVQNFRPGVMDRLGLGYRDLRADRNDLIYVSLSGFGSVGPYAPKGAYDTVIQAYGGVAATQQDADTGEPRFINQTVADKITALYASQAITAALLARERGQGGQHLELAMLDAVVSFLWADAAGNEVLLDADGSLPSSFVQNFKPMRFIDGWGICTPTSDADFKGMCVAFGVEGYDDPKVATIAARYQNRESSRALTLRCYEVASKLSTVEAIAALEAQNVPCGVVLSPAELVNDPHARAIGLFEESVSPVVGRTRIPRHPTQFETTTANLGSNAPSLGAHTDEILTELQMGDHIHAFRLDGVVG